jgi:Phage integrase, N-terminal SAM-like domain
VSVSATPFLGVPPSRQWKSKLEQTALFGSSNGLKLFWNSILLLHVNASALSLLFLPDLSARVRRRAMITTSATPVLRVPTNPAATPRLLDVLQQAAAERGHSVETIRIYVDWTTRFILFHGKRHPRDLTNAEVGRFLGHLAQTDKDALRAIEAARTALDFLYREVLHLDRGELPWAKPPRLLD